MKKQSQNKPNFRKAKMNVTSILTKDYENETTFRVLENKPNQSQFQKPLGSSEVRKPRTGRSILSITPVKRQTNKTTIQTLVHFADTVGFIPGMIQGHILLPSRGGTGKRLITASIALIQKILMQINTIVQWGRRYSMPNDKAQRTRFAAGPASELKR